MKRIITMIIGARRAKPALSKNKSNDDVCERSRQMSHGFKRDAILSPTKSELVSSKVETFLETIPLLLVVELA